MRIAIYKVRLVRDHWANYPEANFTSPQLAGHFFQRLIGQAASEHAAAVFLDAHGVPLGAHIVAAGNLVQVPVLGREVYKAAVVANAAAIIVSHNHPSGSSDPSPADLRVTRRLQRAGDLLGIILLDHIIVTPGPAFTSIREVTTLWEPESTAVIANNSSGSCPPTATP